MAICLLAVYPASRLDCLVLLRLIVVAPVYFPGMPEMPGNPPAWINLVVGYEGIYVAAYGRLAVAVGFVILCLFPHWRALWGWRRPQAGVASAGTPALRPLV
jgi:hypothetical protein